MKLRYEILQSVFIYIGKEFKGLKVIESTFTSDKFVLKFF